MRTFGIIITGFMLTACGGQSSGAGDKLRASFETECDRLVKLDGFDKRFQGKFCSCWATDLEKTLNARSMQQLITMHAEVQSSDEAEDAFDDLEKTAPALGGAAEESADYCREMADK